MPSPADRLELFFYSRRLDLPGAYRRADLHTVTRASTSNRGRLRSSWGPRQRQRGRTPEGEAERLGRRGDEQPRGSSVERHRPELLRAGRVRIHREQNAATVLASGQGDDLPLSPPPRTHLRVAD